MSRSSGSSTAKREAELKEMLMKKITEEVKKKVDSIMKESLENKWKTNPSEPSPPVPPEPKLHLKNGMFLAPDLKLVQRPKLGIEKMPASISSSELCHLSRCDHRPPDEDTDTLYRRVYIEMRLKRLNGPYKPSDSIEDAVDSITNRKIRCGLAGQVLECDEYMKMLFDQFHRAKTVHQHLLDVVEEYGVSNIDFIKELALAIKDLKDKNGIPPNRWKSGLRSNIQYENFIMKEYDKMNQASDDDIDASFRKKFLISMHHFLFFYIYDCLKEITLFEAESSGEKYTTQDEVLTMKFEHDQKLENAFNVYNENNKHKDEVQRALLIDSKVNQRMVELVNGISKRILTYLPEAVDKKMKEPIPDIDDDIQIVHEKVNRMQF